MSAQGTLFGCILPPAAEREAVRIAKAYNGPDKIPCPYRIVVLPELLKLNLLEGTPYKGNHNDIPAIQDDLTARYGVVFTTRRRKGDPFTGRRS